MLGPGVENEGNTRALKSSKLTARNRGEFGSAVLSAGYYAKKLGKTMYIYSGNSFMHRVWRVSDKTSEYLNAINNTGTQVISVTPDSSFRITRSGKLRSSRKRAVTRIVATRILAAWTISTGADADEGAVDDLAHGTASEAARQGRFLFVDGAPTTRLGAVRALSTFTHADHRRSGGSKTMAFDPRTGARGASSFGSARRYYVIRSTDVGKALIRAFGRSWPTANFIGRIMRQDVGKLVYESDGVLQVENNEQRGRRVGGAGRTSTAKH